MRDEAIIFCTEVGTVSGFAKVIGRASSEFIHRVSNIDYRISAERGFRLYLEILSIFFLEDLSPTYKLPGCTAAVLLPTNR